MNKNVLLAVLWTATIASAILCNLFEIGEKINLLKIISMLTAMVAGFFIFKDVNKNLYLQKRKLFEYYLSKFRISVPVILGILFSYIIIFAIVDINYSFSLAILFWISLVSIKKSREPDTSKVINRELKQNYNRATSLFLIIILLVVPFKMVRS